MDLIDREYLESRWGAARVAQLESEGGDVDGAIADATSTAASYLQPRYGSQLSGLTLETTPGALKANVADVAMFNLARKQERIGEDIVRAYQGVDGSGGALLWFTQLARGVVALGLASQPAVDDSVPRIRMSKTKADQVFGNGGLDQW